jgi:WhiB family redox-sensing transcriptional regulator
VNPLDLLRRPDWHHRAACAGQVELMYSEHVGKAKALCKKCPVRPRCLADALARHEPAGVWGGFTAAERNELLDNRENADRMYQVVTRVRSSHP